MSKFIEASAGTGKTYTIQQKVAEIIRKGCPLKKILIVTYTEKAAGELKDRIRKKLEEVLDSEKTDAATAELFDKALRDVDNAAIFTIHSFCQKALKEFAYDAGRPFDLSMIDDKEVEAFVHIWVRDKWPSNELYKKILANESNAQYLEAKICALLVNAVKLYSGKNADGKELVQLDSVENLKFGSAEIDLETAETIAKYQGFEALLQIPEVNENFKILNKYSDTTFDAIQHQQSKDIKKNDKSVQSFIETLSKWSGTGTSKLFGTPQFGNEVVKAANKTVLNSLKFFYDSVNDSSGFLSKSLPAFWGNGLIFKFLYSQIPQLFEVWQSYKAANKLQSFSDMILSVHSAIMNGENAGCSALCEKLRDQYTFAIIDEFQDTNQLQWDIFKKIFLEGKDHSILVVGDPKQSIYSFQGADVKVYTKATDEIHDSEKLDHNYRSTNKIIECCNKLFACPDFFGKTIEFKPSYAPGAKKGDAPEQKANQKPPALLYNAKKATWEECPAFWISTDGIDTTQFAQTCVEKIIECCSHVSEPATKNTATKTRLRVFNKECDGTEATKYRNVSFRDFAILARTRSEMEIIEDAMKHSGVPFTRYKDDNLFFGRECAEWISLFKAIDAPDFTAWNRRILNEALITDFFAISLKDVESDEFDDPANVQRQMIIRWKSLAEKRRFAELQERIYNDSKVESRLMDLSKLQNLTKLRQIGNYAINYLYNHGCTLNELVRHLQNLAHFDGDVDDQDGKLVAKGSDFDAVQVMTIHASKGLEFPVVISVAGFKQPFKTSPGPFLYHNGDEIHLGFGATAREMRLAEELEEWRRLFYVDFTRPSSILILPRYANWYDDEGNPKKDFEFLAKSFNDFCSTQDKGTLYEELPTVETWNVSQERALKRIVRDFILTPIKEEKRRLHQETSEGEEALKSQETFIEKLKKEVASLGIMQHSYSTLSGKIESSVSIDEDENLNKEGPSESAAMEDDMESGGLHEEDIIHYPRGSKLGNALHSILEHLKFHEFGLNHPNFESCLQSAELSDHIEEQFKVQSLPIWNHKEEWTQQTLKYIWNTMNASFDAIEAGSKSGAKFKLTEIEPYCSKAEAQFNLNATSEENGEASEYLQSICKGFIDLMFMRKDTKGNIRYSILDWKSDIIANGDYSPNTVRAKVDEEYSVQRVLYSYCLIKWLKQFYGESSRNEDLNSSNKNVGLSEEEIFEKYFGGIYYVFVRGTAAETGNGIYAHTWKDYKSLRESYENIRKLMHKRKMKEGAV